jgi:hypothetical protein
MNKSIIAGLLMVMNVQLALAGSMLDPTRPSGTHTPVAIVVNTFHLEGIVVSDTTQWAIVNGTVVHRGDHIANAVIEEISRYSVRYSRNGHSEVALLAHATLQVRRNNTEREVMP